MASTSHLHCDRGVRIPPVVHQRYWNDIYISTKMKFQKYTSSQEVRVTSCFSSSGQSISFWVLKAVGSNLTKYFQDTLLAFLLLILWGCSKIGNRTALAMQSFLRVRVPSSPQIQQSWKNLLRKIEQWLVRQQSKPKVVGSNPTFTIKQQFFQFSLDIIYVQQSRKKILRQISSLGRAQNL